MTPAELKISLLSNLRNHGFVVTGQLVDEAIECVERLEAALKQAREDADRHVADGDDLSRRNFALIVMLTEAHSCARGIPLADARLEVKEFLDAFGKRSI